MRHERRRSKRLYRPTSPCFFTSPEHLFISPEHLHPLAEPRAAFGRRVLGATAGGLHHRHPLSHSTTHHSTPPPRECKFATIQRKKERGSCTGCEHAHPHPLLHHRRKSKAKQIESQYATYSTPPLHAAKKQISSKKGKGRRWTLKIAFSRASLLLRLSQPALSFTLLST